MKLRSRKGFTLAEALLAAAISAYALSGIMAMYLYCHDLVSTSRNLSVAINAAQGLVEEMRNYPFSQIFDDYDGLNFIVNSMPQNMGVVYVDDTEPELLRVTISICWRQKNRVIGEDQNLNGALEAGERKDANDMIDSPAQLVTLLVNR